ncbi:MAG: hypothetical protein Q4G19_07355 [Clostridia bacterium]|nr:hypothetical protein [Clostridia bacterium]
MFLRKLTVIAVPLGLLVLLCILIPLMNSLGFFGNVLLGALLGVMLSLLLPLAGATRMREPFAHLLWIPTATVLLVLLVQYLNSVGVSSDTLKLLATGDSRVITVESAFAAYMITFSARTGKGI